MINVFDKAPSLPLQSHMLVDILNPHPEKGLIIEHQRIRNKVTKQDAIAVQNKPSKKTLFSTTGDDLHVRINPA